MSSNQQRPPMDAETRAAWAEELAAHYRAGKSVRVLAHTYGRSYGMVHRLLSEAGVEFRPRGGNQKSGSGGRDV